MHYVTEGVNKEILEDLNKKYLAPENGTFLKSPKMNDEIDICLSRDARKQDFFVAQIQTCLTSGLTALGSLMSTLIEKPEMISTDKILSILAESGQLFTHAQNSLSKHRRFLAKPFLKEDLRKVIDECPVDEYLFSSKLNESIKNSKDMTEEC